MLAHVRTSPSAPRSTNTQVARRHTSPRQTRDGARATHPTSQPPFTVATIDAARVTMIQVDTSLLEPRRGSIRASILPRNLAACACRPAGATVAAMPAHDDAERVLELAVFAAGGVTRHALPAQGSVSIGRSEENDIRIDDGSVSRRHAVIHLGHPGAPPRIEDLGSANGTRIRREQGTGSTTKLFHAQLEHGKAVEFSVGDAISVGTVLVVVRWRAPVARAGGREGPGEPIVRDEAMQRLYALAERVAGAPLSVLLLGETGAGKEVLAEHIHRRSPRAAGALVRRNCAALGESLLESELCGHEKGA